MSTAPQRRSKTVSEVRNVAVDMRGKLDDGELLTGVPTVEELSTSDLSFSNEAISIAELIINNRSVPIGMAAQFAVSGGVAGRTYTIRITVGTTSTPAQTLVEQVVLLVVGEE